MICYIPRKTKPHMKNDLEFPIITIVLAGCFWLLLIIFRLHAVLLGFGWRFKVDGIFFPVVLTNMKLDFVIIFVPALKCTSLCKMLSGRSTILFCQHRRCQNSWTHVTGPVKVLPSILNRAHVTPKQRWFSLVWSVCTTSANVAFWCHATPGGIILQLVDLITCHR